MGGGGGGRAHTVMRRGRRGLNIITDHRDPGWGGSSLQQLIVLRNTELWPLWPGMQRLFAVHRQTGPGNIIRP